jgi:hypothetical protein
LILKDYDDFENVFALSGSFGKWVLSQVHFKDNHCDAFDRSYFDNSPLCKPSKLNMLYKMMFTGVNLLWPTVYFLIIITCRSCFAWKLTCITFSDRTSCGGLENSRSTIDIASSCATCCCICSWLLDFKIFIRWIHITHNIYWVWNAGKLHATTFIVIFYIFHLDWVHFS